MRVILIDGYNVILRSPAFRPDDRRDLAAARDKLVNLLSWAVGAAGDARFVIVFDGADVGAAARRAASGSDRVEVRYSQPPLKADDVIRALVEEWSEIRDDLSVVTSDLEIARHARAHNATVVLSDLFAASLFRERVEERLKDALRTAKGGRKGRRGAKAGGTGSPTAAGSDAEDKPPGVSKKHAEEWLRLFEEQKKNEEEG
jgi:predicted RNA-binding protein with PIN domain